MKKSLWFLSLLVCGGCTSSSVRPGRDATNHAPNAAPLAHFHTETVTLELGKTNFGERVLNVRIGIMDPVEAPVGDVIFVHGFADRLDNHLPLYQSWAQRGLRVISFDLPSHGEDSGSGNNLADFTFQDLAFLIGQIENHTKPKTPRPLLLAGWSVGGLVVVRTLQERWFKEFSRPIAGAVLLAPGVSVRKYSWSFGNSFGDLTTESLTHDPNPPHVGEVDAKSPAWSHLISAFSPRMVLASIMSQGQVFPVEVPAMVVLGSDFDDAYVKNQSVKEWVVEQNQARKDTGRSAILALQCPKARHELDNELPQYGRNEVREMTGQFLEQVARTGVVDLVYSPHQICQVMQ